MSIGDLGEKIKRGGESAWFSVGARFRYVGTLLRAERFEKYYIVAVVILVGFASFGLGRISVLEEAREPITIDQTYESANVVSPTAKAVGAPAAAAGGQAIVASKNGTKYYFTWCAGADRISPANKIFFNSETEAKARGLAPAANCKGLGN